MYTLNLVNRKCIMKKNYEYDYLLKNNYAILKNKIVKGCVIMRIRSHQIYPVSELYSLYKVVREQGEVFDAFTLNISVYIEPGKLLDEQEFGQQCKRAQVNQYVKCETYTDYKDAQENHSNVVLPNNVVLTIFTDYTELEFEQVQDGSIIKQLPRKSINGVADQIYNSNKIEGIDVTLNDTKTILAGGKVVNVKYDDELSVLNAKDAFDLRSQMAGFVVEPYYICRLHYELMKGLREDAGRFRNHDVYIGSASHAFPSFEAVPTKVKKLVSLDSEDSIMKACLIHAEFVNIHPFGDGNGRVGRLLTHPYVNIPFEDRLEYYTALDAYGKYGSIYALYSLVQSLNSDITKSHLFNDVNKLQA
jgi:hypothetical protein